MQPTKVLFDDLLTVEVNLIRSNDVHTFERSTEPDDLDAVLHELTVTYRAYLDEHVPALDEAWRSWVGSGPPVPPRPRPDTAADALAKIGSDAAAAERMGRALIAAGRWHDRAVVNVLRRIRGTVEQVGHADGGLQTRISRKAWELGTSTIVAQTIVQVDGDVIQRIDPAIGDVEVMLDLHRSAVVAAVGQWQHLIELFAHLVVGSIGILASLVRRGHGVRAWRADKRQLVALSDRSLRQLLAPAEMRRTWRLARQRTRELFAAGGATIMAPSTDGVPGVARTVLQPDGDSLWFVGDDAIGRRRELGCHVESVRQWYDETGRLAATVQRYTTALQLAVATVVAAGSVLVGLLQRSWIPVLTGLAVSFLVPIGLRLVVRQRLRRLLR